MFTIPLGMIKNNIISQQPTYQAVSGYWTDTHIINGYKGVNDDNVWTDSNRDNNNFTNENNESQSRYNGTDQILQLDSVNLLSGDSIDTSFDNADDLITSNYGKFSRDRNINNSNGWSFEVSIKNDIDITHLQVTQFGFRNANNQQLAPSSIKLYGKNLLSDSWGDAIGTINITSSDSLVRRNPYSTSISNTNYFKYFKIDMTDSTRTDKPTQITDFIIRGIGYNYSSAAGIETLIYNNVEIKSGYLDLSNNQTVQIFDSFSNNDNIIKLSSQTISDIENIIETDLSTSSQTTNNDDTLDNGNFITYDVSDHINNPTDLNNIPLYGHQPRTHYGWGFILNIKDTNIDTIQPTEFYYENLTTSNSHRWKSPRWVHLWGQEPNSQNWEFIYNVYCNGSHNQQKGGIFSTQKKFAKFKIFLSASTGGGTNATRITNFYIHGNCYKTYYNGN